MSLRELLATYLPPPPEPPGLVELLALTNDLKSDWNRMMAAARYDEDKKRRWLALRERANPPGRVEWPLAPPDEMVQLRRAQAATGKLINEYESEKASREDYILELRAKLKRAATTNRNLACDVDRANSNAYISGRRLAATIDELQQRVEFGDILTRKDREQGQAAIAKLRGVQEELAIAQANAESLERGLPAAVEAALRPAVEAATASYGATIDEQDRENAQLREELATVRKYVCELITDRDAAKKERDEAVATAESTRRRLQDANEALRAAFNNACADRDAAKELLTQAQRQLMANRLPGAVLEENENLRKLSSEACAEREELRKQLASTEDARLYAIRVANSAAEQHTTGAKTLRRVDQTLADYAGGIFKARDVVKELCRLRGIRT